MIVTLENLAFVRQWAIDAGFAPSSVHAMSTVDLANLYHDRVKAQSPLHVRRLIADAIGATFAALSASVLSAAPARAVPSVVHYATPQVIRTVRRGHAVMMVGPAGCGKTTIGEHAARALDLPFFITSTVNDTHELMGFVDGYGKYHRTAFRNAYENGGLWIADEIDAWEAAALLVANSALANGVATFPDVPNPVRRHADFRMVATANTFGTGADRVYVGRNELDAASLDRFAVIAVDYDLTLERFFAAGSDEWLDHVWRVRRIVNDKKIRHVVSSRAISMGAAALKDGETFADTNEIYLLKGMSAADRSKLK